MGALAELDTGEIRGGPGNLCLIRTHTSNEGPVKALTCVANSEQVWSQNGDQLRSGPDCRRILQLWECSDADPDQLWTVS